jgi:hypothetical protein
MKLAPKLLAPLVALALVAGACGDGGGKRPAVDTITDIRESDAKDVKPPERVDPKDVALPGLTLVTNSPTWQDLVKSPSGRGAVILFVLPTGPADHKGLARGDLIKEIDGQVVGNYEHALSLLHSRRGEERTLLIRGKNRKERTVKIKGQIPRRRARPYLDRLIKQNANDPVLRYLRAETSGGTVADALADLNKALEREPQFVEAMASKANIIFNQRLTTKDKKKQDEFAADAIAGWTNALDIDPQNAFALALQANAKTTLGQASAGKVDATKALRVDGTIASANHALARANLALKKPQDAAGPARAALELNPYSNLTYYRTLAETFKSLKRKSDCAATLTAVVPYLEGTQNKFLKKEAEQLEKEAKEECG